MIWVVSSLRLTSGCHIFDKHLYAFWTSFNVASLIIFKGIVGNVTMLFQVYHNNYLLYNINQYIEIKFLKQKSKIKEILTLIIYNF